MNFKYLLISVIPFILQIAHAESPTKGVISSNMATVEETSTQMNLRADPTGLFLGFSKLEVDVEIAPAISIGPRVSYWGNQAIGGLTSENVWQVGVVGTYSFGGHAFSSGWYVAPGVLYQSMKLVENSNNLGQLSGSRGGVVAELVGGYQWFWSNGLNRIGPTISSVNSVDLVAANGVVRDSYSGIGNGVGFASDFSLGYAF